MRLIDADALIEWINEQREQVTKKQVAGTDGSIFTREALVTMQRCIGAFETKINNMPTAYDVDAVVDQKVGGWIPCSERLPEESGKYLVTVENLTGYWIMENNVLVCDYQYNEFIFQGWEDNKVIAWQPLPNPYKPEGE